MKEKAIPVISRLSEKAEEICLAHSSRGMHEISHRLKPGYLYRGAKMLAEHDKRPLIATGFFVNHTFETDGPVGAIALYDSLKLMRIHPWIVTSFEIAEHIKSRFDTIAFPVLSDAKSHALAKKYLNELNPSLLISIEHVGRAGDGNYYNMHGKDISAFSPKIDTLFLQNHLPSLCFGDGGNEIGMGNIEGDLSDFPINHSVITCDELVIATTSNWGVYGLIALLSCLLGRNLLSTINLHEIYNYLLERKAVDGITGLSTPSVDGHEIDVSLDIIAKLDHLVCDFLKCDKI